ncbi:MAG TPA: DUF4097 family beta strand repeat-containing protein, partial [Nannocystaceae bacterium]|nr:DUF4097 family beta strand repeat-containing protein [Nannocystaceae bacterium]
VEVELGEVDLEVEGWAKAKVEVTEDIAGGWTARLEEEGARVVVRIDGPPGIPTGGTLKLRVPKGADLQLTSRGGDVRGVNLHGRASVASIGGDVRLSGPATRVEVATTSGEIRIDGANGRVDVATVSGKLALAGIKGELRAQSVSGDVEIDKARIDRLQLTTVSGDVELTGELRKGPHGIDTNSGDVRVTLPRNLALRIVVSSFSGTISDGFADPPGKHEGSHRRELGKGGATLEISTFSGDVKLVPQGAG